MARSRKYGWNGELPAKELSGQALIVFNGLKALPGELHTGHEWNDLIGKDLRTRQDSYRVVLYYILVLKSKGLVRTAEHEIVATTKDNDGKHNVVVKTDTAVSEVERVAEEIAQENDDQAADAEGTGDDDEDSDDEDVEDEDEAEAQELLAE